MKFKFFIFVLGQHDIMSISISLYPVIVKETGRWLEFSDYIAAEGWIKEQRANGNTDMYQIQKIYTV